MSSHPISLAVPLNHRPPRGSLHARVTLSNTATSNVRAAKWRDDAEAAAGALPTRFASSSGIFRCRRRIRTQ